MVGDSISIAMPYHGDRRKYASKTIHNTGKMPFVKEVVVTLEPGSTFNVQNGKVRRYQNDKRLYVMRNKYEAVLRCKSDWVALIDSDNIVDYVYFDVLTHLNPDVIYCPEMGLPRLIYSDFVGKDICRETFVDLSEINGFDTLLNTMNYVFNRERWLKAVKPAIDNSWEPLSADSIWINYHCLKAGMVLRVIEGMIYRHTVDDTSFYSQNIGFGLTECPRITRIMKAEFDDRIPEQQLIKPKNWSAQGENADSSKSISDAR